MLRKLGEVGLGTTSFLPITYMKISSAHNIWYHIYPIAVAIRKGYIDRRYWMIFYWAPGVDYPLLRDCFLALSKPFLERRAVARLTIAASSLQKTRQNRQGNKLPNRYYLMPFLFIALPFYVMYVIQILDIQY